MNYNTYGIDLGTRNIKIYNSASDSILVEKNMIAINNKKHLLAFGDEAYDMYEKAPSNISISSPLTHGVIADIKNMEQLLYCFIEKCSKGNIKPADYYIAVPTDVTEVEKRAFYDLVRGANVKAKKIRVIERSICDGLGLDIDVKNAQGVLVVNVGFDTTEISLLSLGGIVLSRMIKVGGFMFDDAIRNTLRKENNLFIGEKTAERARFRLQQLNKEGKKASFHGREIITGLPVEREVDSNILVASLKEHYDVIIDNIRQILERTPPELGSDIYKNGIYLTGGASSTSKLFESIANGVNLKVNLTQTPVETVAMGIRRVIKEDVYKSVAYEIEGISR